MEKVTNHTYLINLDSRLDRLKHSHEELINNGFTYKRFPAVSGKNLPDSYIRTILSSDALNTLDELYRNNHYQLTRGGVGCALSHINIWKILVNSNNDYALIFEDDILFGEKSLYLYFQKYFKYTNKQNIYYNTIDLFLKKMEHKNINWDILLLQTMKPYNLDLIQDQSIPLINIKTDKNYYLVKQNVFWGTGGYFITKKCALKLLSDVFPLKEQIDFYLSKKSLQKEINIYSIQPNILNQSILLNTDIQNACPKCDINTEIKPYINQSNIFINKSKDNFILLYIIIIILIFIFYLSI